MKRRFAIIASLALCLAALTLAACDGSTVAEATADTPTGEELIQSNSDMPFQHLDRSQVVSIVANYDGYSHALPSDEFDSVIDVITQLRTYPDVIVDYKSDTSIGSLHFCDDQFVVTLADGTSFSIALWGRTDEYDCIFIVDGEAHAGDYDEAAESFVWLYSDYVDIIREESGMNDITPDFDFNAPQSAEEFEEMAGEFIEEMRGGN